MHGWTHQIAAKFAFSPDPAASLKQSDEALRKALALDDTLPDAISGLADLSWMRGNYDEALKEGRRAITIDPNSAEMYAVLASYTYSSMTTFCPSALKAVSI